MPLTIESPNIEKYELPKILTPKQVQYYSSHTHQLAHSQVHKAILFLEKGCIQYDSINKCFWCLPLANYNKNTYKIIKSNKGFICDCQGCQKKIRECLYNPDIEESAACSHILALMYFFKLKHWNEEGIRNSQEVLTI